MGAFDSFAVGDHVWFDRSFTEADFAAFSRLSGDRNPLHHDHAYGAANEFGRTIVPLHLTSAPLSAIAGMVFPGEPSLYLGHRLRASKPVFYGDTLTYSARVVMIVPERRVLRLSVVAFRGTEIVLDAELDVQARCDTWSGQSEPAVCKAEERGVALVTGAAGAIGAAIATRLRRAGWRVIGQGRTAPAVGAAFDGWIEGDLAVAADLDRLCGEVAALDVATIVHAASPPVDAPADLLASVNAGAFRRLAEAALPAMLKRQWGVALLIGSSAVDELPRGWEDYAGAKAMAATVVASLRRHYAQFGIRALTLAPGFVVSRFSDALRPADASCLIPEEVAEAAVDLIREARADGPSYVRLSPGSRSDGDYRFVPADHREATDTRVTVSGGAVAAAAPADDIASIVRAVLRLPAGSDLADAGLGRTSGWDSLAHIQLMLAIESRLGLRFAASEFERTKQYDSLVGLVAEIRSRA